MKYLLTIGVALMLSTAVYSQPSDSLKLEIIKAVLSDTTEFNALPFVIADIMGINITMEAETCEDILLGNEWREIGNHDVGDVQYLTLYRKAVQIGISNAVNNNVAVLGLKDGINAKLYEYKFCATLK